MKNNLLRGCLFIFLLLLVVVFIIGGATSVLETASYALMQKAASVYGDFHGMAFGCGEDAVQLVESSPFVRDYAIVYSYGMYDISQEVTMTLGTFDEKAWKGSAIQLLEGHLPEKDNEIVLEECWKEEGWQIGDTISFPLVGEEREKTFTICGWINNYRVLWGRTKGSLTNPHLPSGLIAKDALRVKTMHIMVWMSQTNRTDSSENVFNNLRIPTNQRYPLYNTYYYNTAVYTDGGGMRFYEFRMTMMLVLVVASLTAVYGRLMRLIRQYREQDIPGKKILGYIAGTVVGGAMAGLLAQQLLSPVCKAMFGYGMPLLGGWWAALVMAICSFGLAILEYRRQQSRKMLTELLGRHIPEDAKILRESRRRRSRRTCIAVCVGAVVLAMALSSWSFHLEVYDYGLNWEPPIVTTGEFPEIPRFHINMHYGMGEDILSVLYVCRMVAFLCMPILIAIGADGIYMEYVRQDAHAFRALCDEKSTRHMLQRELQWFLLWSTLCAVVLCRITILLTSGAGIPHYLSELLYALPGIVAMALIGLLWILWMARRAAKHIWKE